MRNKLACVFTGVLPLLSRSLIRPHVSSEEKNSAEGDAPPKEKRGTEREKVSPSGCIFIETFGGGRQRKS